MQLSWGFLTACLLVCHAGPKLLLAAGIMDLADLKLGPTPPFRERVGRLFLHFLASGLILGLRNLSATGFHS
jgi:hypothetical protein